jgi:hypothetical protein
VLDAAVIEVAADRQHLEPVEVAQGLRGLLDRAVDRLGDASVEVPVISTDL